MVCTQLKLPSFVEEKRFPELEVYSLKHDLAKKYYESCSKSRIEEISPRVEIWTSCASNRRLAYLSHGIFRYFGKFPPPVANYLIKKYTTKGDLVIDPMCGSGTTALECLILDRNSECFDVNPLSILITTVKIKKISEYESLKFLDKLLLKIRGFELGKPYKPMGLKNPEHWFYKETINSLSKIKFSIENMRLPEDIRNVFLISFLSIVRKVSKATTQQGRLFLDVDSAIKDATDIFEKRAKEIINCLSKLPKKDLKMSIKQSSASDINLHISNKAKLVICHPPYFNSYKFSSVNSLELSWLGIEPSLIRLNEVREYFKVGKPENYINYVDDMEKILRSLKNCLTKNGKLALMIGDTYIKGQYIPVTKYILDRVNDVYEVENSALRIPQFTEASWAASQRRDGKSIGVNICDFVVVLRLK